ncbi:uncharacterized protein PG998_014809 [Apiospora kogelbergensis]|uniref:uncharacterized protein n=1 Tax=Apiospora kogelbergensis TaxID=1337665 RepID=UPI00312F42E5
MGKLLQSNGNTRTTPDSATLGRPVDNNTKRMTENAGHQNNASNSTEDIEMEVEKLLEHRQVSDGSIEILVKWVGQPKEDASFEPEHEIQQGTTIRFKVREMGRPRQMRLAGSYRRQHNHPILAITSILSSFPK